MKPQHGVVTCGKKGEGEASDKSKIASFHIQSICYRPRGGLGKGGGERGEKEMTCTHTKQNITPMQNHIISPSFRFGGFCLCLLGLALNSRTACPVLCHGTHGSCACARAGERALEPPRKDACAPTHVCMQGYIQTYMPYVRDRDDLWSCFHSLR